MKSCVQKKMVVLFVLVYIPNPMAFTGYMNQHSSLVSNRPTASAIKNHFGKNAKKLATDRDVIFERPDFNTSPEYYQKSATAQLMNTIKNRPFLNADRVYHIEEHITSFKKWLVCLNANRASHSKMITVCISGPSFSGKTHLANYLAHQFELAVQNDDSYIRKTYFQSLWTRVNSSIYERPSAPQVMVWLKFLLAQLTTLGDDMNDLWDESSTTLESLLRRIAINDATTIIPIFIEDAHHNIHQAHTMIRLLVKLTRQIFDQHKVFLMPVLIGENLSEKFLGKIVQEDEVNLQWFETDGSVASIKSAQELTSRFLRDNYAMCVSINHYRHIFTLLGRRVSWIRDVAFVLKQHHLPTSFFIWREWLALQENYIKRDEMLTLELKAELICLWLSNDSHWEILVSEKYKGQTLPNHLMIRGDYVQENGKFVRRLDLTLSHMNFWFPDFFDWYEWLLKFATTENPDLSEAWLWICDKMIRFLNNQNESFAINHETIFHWTQQDWQIIKEQKSNPLVLLVRSLYQNK
jgi:hypothetical protein